MNKIILKKVNLKKTKIIYEYSIEGEISKYFKKTRQYSIDYSCDISETPKSIASIPFTTNILPIVWLFNAELVLSEIDASFLKSIDEIKNGYQKMYPNITFGGKIICKKIIENNYPIKNRVGAFYSGGLDATSTVVTHYEEKPLLINLQGSDINLKYKTVSDGVKKLLQSNANELNLEIIFLDSEFRNIFKEKTLDKYSKSIVNDNYWHAFQHGIAIIGHAAPIAYKYNFKTVYIAASFSIHDRGKYNCASDPLIDNHVKLSKTSVYHDGYEFTRNDKSENVGKFSKTHNKKLKLRVCLDDYRIDNCLHCEKCYRTIFGFAAKGYSPEIIGFDLTDKDYAIIEKDFKNRIMLRHTIQWSKIQAEFKKHPEFKKDPRFSWIYTYDFEKCNKKPSKYALKVYYAIIKRINRIKKMLQQKGF